MMIDGDDNDDNDDNDGNDGNDSAGALPLGSDLAVCFEPLRHHLPLPPSPQKRSETLSNQPCGFRDVGNGTGSQKPRQGRGGGRLTF